MGHDQIYNHEARGFLAHEVHGGLTISGFAGHAKARVSLRKREEQPTEVGIVINGENVGCLRAAPPRRNNGQARL